MLIPLRTDRPPKRRPIITEMLIAVNLLIYLIGVSGSFWDKFDADALVAFGHYVPRDFKLWQLFTYQFIHDPNGIGHIAFNMLFLWVFGAAVEDRLTRPGFLAFYLIGGAMAGIAHGIASPESSVIGASGSIAAVTGAFLALFPRSKIQILFFFFIIGLYYIPSLWFIGFYFFIDVARQVFSSSKGDVAYMAHIAGYVYGFGIGFTLLATKIIKHEEFDVFFLFKQAKRRREFRSASKKTSTGMWSSPQKNKNKRNEKVEAKDKPLDKKQMRQLEQRSEISRLITSHNLSEAANKYQLMLKDDPDATLIEAHQLDIANKLYEQDKSTDAATAYELFLARYKTSHKADEVRLLLSILYVRKLNKPEQARKLLEKAKASLRSEGHTILVDQLLNELET